MTAQERQARQLEAPQPQRAPRLAVAAVTLGAFALLIAITGLGIFAAFGILAGVAAIITGIIARRASTTPATIAVSLGAVAILVLFVRLSQ